MLLFMVSLLKNRFSDAMNRSFWFGKTFFLIGITIFSFQVGIWFYKQFFYLAVIASPIAIFLILIAVMDLILKAGDYFASKYFDENSKISLTIILGISFLSIYGIIKLLLVTKANSKDEVSVWIYLALLVISLVLTIAKLNPEAKVQNTLPYMTLMALLLYFYTGSNQDLLSTSLTKQHQLIFYFVCFLLGTFHISLIDSANQDYKELGAGPQPESNRGYEMTNTQDDSQITSGNGESASPATISEQEEALGLFRKQTVIFHAYMVMVGLLAVALLTNWTFDADGDLSATFDPRGKTAYVVQLIAYATGTAAFIWTLTAPYFFPDRDFT